MPENPDPKESEEGLQRLQKELYAKEEGEDLVLRRKELSLTGKRIPSGPGGAGPAADLKFANTALARAQRRRKWLLVGGGIAALIIIFVLAVLVTLRFRASRQVIDEQIGIEVRGPAQVTAGGSAEYIVAYRNDSRLDWQSVELVLDLPEGVTMTSAEPQPEGSGRELVWRLGNVPRGSVGEVKVIGRLIGEEGAVAVTQAELTLTPENFPSGRFSKTALFTTTIAALPIDLSIEAATTAGSGERIRGIVHVRNLGGEPLANAVLTVAGAPGAELAVEDPEFSPGFETTAGEWRLETIPALGEATRTIIFSVAGQAGERRMLDIQVGVKENETVYVQRTLTQVVTVSASELTIEQSYNGSAEPQAVFPEEAVKAVLRYANVGTVGMRNVVVTARFEGEGLDAAQLRLPSGAYDPVTRTITWTSASFPALSVVQPGQEGALEFEFKILPATRFPATGEQTKNFTLVSMATVDSLDLTAPVGQEKKIISDRAVLSVGTVLGPTVSAFYDDGRLGIKSAGPVPPKAGQTTTYTVQVRLGSALNDVGEAEVVALLPDGVGYTGKTVVSKGSVEFDERSREVVWQIPLLEGLTGRARPAEELHFQVSVTPGANLIGNIVPLLTKLTAEGQDMFIEEAVRAEVKELPSTETASPGKGQVE